MALVVKDRVRETSTTTGTGTITLAGAVTGYQSFSAIGNANTTYYTIYLQGGNEWEVGIGTYTASGTTLSRDTILASSNGGSAVNFSAGVKDVFVTYPAGRSVYYDTATNVTLNALTLSGGTANGVLYLNGSKEATSGSALTFDGATLATTGGINSDNTSTLAKTAGQSLVVGNLSAAGAKLDVQTASGTASTLRLFQNGISNFVLSVPANEDALAFLQYGSSELMRLTSTGLGIGTSSPNAKLDVNGITQSRGNIYGGVANTVSNIIAYANVATGGAGTSQFLFGNTSSDSRGYFSYSHASDTLLIGTAGATQATLSASGNLGLGVTPSAWGSSNRAFQVATAGAIWSPGGTDIRLSNNQYRDSANSRIYIANGYAQEYAQDSSGNHVWLIAPSGNANDPITFTQAMTLDASGNLGIGTSSPVQKLTVNGGLNVLGAATLPAAQGSMVFSYESPVSRCYMGDGTGYSFAFSKRVSSTTTDLMTLTDAGNLGIGTTSPTSKLHIYEPTAAAAIIRVLANGGQQSVIQLAGNGTTFGTTSFDVFQDGGSDAYVANRANASLQFWTNNTERARITAAGTFQTSLDASIYGVTVGRGAGAVSTNTAVGASALASNTTGDRNTAVGYLVLSANTTGVNNVGVGGNDGSIGVTFGSNTSGANNVAIGNGVLFANTTGGNNAAVGHRALQLNTTGANNVAVGMLALQANTTASNNTAVGYQAGYANTTGAGNILIGALAGYSITTANGVTAIGFNALSANTSTGSNNTALGSYTLRANTTGTMNTAIGGGEYGVEYGALGYNTTGSYNTAVGHYALRANTTASHNTAVGFQAGYSNTTGAQNTFVGLQVGYANTTGTNNSAFGSITAGFASSTLSSNTTGVQNNAFGASALASNTTGGENSAFGFLALLSNTTANYNSAFGNRAMQSNTTGANNTAHGYQALFSNTTASNNTAVGYQAGYANTTGRITAIGFQSLVNNTTASANTAVGYVALQANTTGAANTAVGDQALNANTTASNNTAVGYQAAYSNTTGTLNVAVGSYSLNQNTTGNYNTALGYYSLGANTTGAENTAVGMQALYVNTTGADNTAVGFRALDDNTTGSVNDAFGVDTLGSTTTGSANSGFGAGALALNTTGNYNVAVGRSALQNNTASHNTAVGYQAGYANTTGYFNTNIGTQAGYSVTTGNENTAVGFGAGYSQTTATGNTLIGRSAGELVTTGSSNTFVGGRSSAGGFSGGVMTTGSNNTILGNYNGNQGGLDIRTANNYIVLSDGDGNPRQIIDGSGNVGIGTDAPRGVLDLNTTRQVKVYFGTAGTIGETQSTAGDYTANNLFVSAESAGTMTYTKTTGDSGNAIIQDFSRGITFYTGVTGAATTTGTLNNFERMRLDSSGNLFLKQGYFSLNNNGYIRADVTNQLCFQSGTSGTVFRKSDNSTDYMTLDASGNLQIGNTSYAYRVAASRASDGIVGYFRRDGATVNPALTISCNETGNTVGFGTDYAGATSPAMTFSTQATERARITSGGYFKASNDGTYVGSTGAYHELRTNAADYVAYITNSNASSPYGFEVTYTGTDPNGTGNRYIGCYASSTQRMEVRSNGGIANYQANDVNLSDRREKTNFAPAKSYLDIICSIPVQTFNYIDQSKDDPGLTLGVVAQDVQAVAPELVSESNWGTEDNPKMRLSIYQTDLQYALMKCIQEQQTMINELKAEVAALKGA